MFRELKEPTTAKILFKSNKTDDNLNNLEFFKEIISTLKTEDIINLYKPKDSPVDIYVDSQAWFKGKLGVANKSLAVEIDEVLVQENIMNHLMGLG